jgi:hypothetical protein
VKPLVSMRRALEDQSLFGAVLGGESWAAWRTLLIACMGEELNREERRLFAALTKRPQEPHQLVECFVGIVGRRGGKSRAAAVLAVFIAALCDHADKFVPGERPLVLCIAQNVRQAAIVFGYIVGILEAVPALAGMIQSKTADSLTLSNGVSVEVRPASFRGLRGITALAVLCDESCFWYSDDTSANADAEILAAVRPSLATTGGPLVLISSPYSKRGETYELWRRHFGQQGDPLILVAQGASRDFNPSLPQKIVDRALEADYESASAEYLGLWRSDIASFVDRAVVDACVIPGRFELPRVSGIGYRAFIDAAGGSGGDSMTVAIAHRERIGERDVAVLDAVREIRPPFSPDQATVEFAGVIRGYGISRATADRWGCDWVAEAFAKHGVRVEQCARPKSDLYRELLAPLNSGRVELLDNPRLVAQLCGLERRTARSGRDSIDHAQGGHDDLINSAAGALTSALEGAELITFSESMIRSLELGLV